MHPILQKYLNENESAINLFTKHREWIDEPILEAISTIYQESPCQHPSEKLKNALSFDYQQSSCREFSIFYLLMLHRHYGEVLNEQNENVYLKTALELVGHTVLPSIAFLAYALNAVNSLQNHAEDRFHKYLKFAKENFSLTHFIDYRNFIFFILTHRAFDGKLFLHQEDKKNVIKRINASALEEKQKKILLESCHGLEFIDAVARGDVKKSKEHLKKITDFNPLIQRFMTYMYLQKNVLEPSKWVDVTLYQKPEEIPLWVQVDMALLRNDPVLALQKAKQLIASESKVLANSFLYLLKAELANKDEEAAQWIINKHQHLCHDIEDMNLHICRLYLLKGQKEKALHYFIQYDKYSTYYHKKGMLKHQLQQSVEIDHHTKQWLLKSAKEDKNSFTPQRQPNNIHAATGLIVGDSLATKKLKEKIRQYAPLDAMVLITGETGVGKELVANELHQQSQRAKEPYLTINCSAIPDTLLQSELFGHMAGAYTSANQSRQGLFETAGKGTVFLDEFGDISPLLQVSLLRVFENMEVRPIGSNEPKKIYCRFIIATNANLQQLVNENRFRKDLYFRIKKLEIPIKPLRERKEDIIPLANYFLNAQRIGKKANIMDPLKKKLTDHPWEGNVRELKSEMEKARLLHSDKIDYYESDFELLPTNKNSDFENEKKPNIPKKLVSKNEEEIFANDLERAKQVKIRPQSTTLRIKRILNLFTHYPQLSRQEIAEILEVSPRTITKDLKQLIAENKIKKIMPTDSPRTHYFILNV